ncbi:MAG: hypothetical protein COB38_05815 [Gammaproteobacteria bacterium]|nr:MAG: hypothetical protein COB38_05815 [Gammaproteobacteria bacterium]
MEIDLTKYGYFFIFWYTISLAVCYFLIDKKRGLVKPMLKSALGVFIPYIGIFYLYFLYRKYNVRNRQQSF